MQVVPLPGQHAKLSVGDAAADGGNKLGASYFAALPFRDSALEGQQIPEVLPLLQTALAGVSGANWGSKCSMQRLAVVLLRAAEQRLQVLHQQQLYQQHLCPVLLLPARGEVERPGTSVGTDPKQHTTHGSLGRVVGQADTQQELRALATALTEAAAAAAAAAGSTAASSAGSSDGRGAEGSLPADSAHVAALQLAVESTAMLQQWASQPALLHLLCGCFQQALGPAADLHVAGPQALSQPEGPQQQVQQQQLCLQLLLHPDLLEWPGLRAVLPAAAAMELLALLG